MTDRPADPDDRLALLVDRYLDGVLSDAELAELNAALLRDPAQRDRFVELMIGDRTLREAHRAHAAPISDLESEPDAEPPAGSYRIGRGTWAALAAAVVVAAGALAAYTVALSTGVEAPKPNDAPGAVATLLETDGGGTLTAGDSVLFSGQEIAAGPIELDAGSADLRLASGVDVRIRGGARLHVTDPMRAAVTAGRARFDCPPNAVGFTVDLPDRRRVVDLGTAFEIDIDDTGRTRVWVTQGRVRIESAAPDASAHASYILSAGQVAVVNAPRFGDASVVARRALLTPDSVRQVAGDTHPDLAFEHLIDPAAFDVPPTLGDLPPLPDDQTSRRWATASAGSPNYFDRAHLPRPAFVFGLGAPTELHALVVWGYGGNTNEATDFTVEFSTDGGATWQPHAQHLSTERLLGADAAVLRFDRPRRADAVRLTLTANAHRRGFPGVGGDRVGLGPVRFLGDRPDPDHPFNHSPTPSEKKDQSPVRNSSGETP